MKITYNSIELKAPIQKEFEIFLDSDPSIDEIIIHPSLAIVLNPQFSGTQIEKYINDRDQIVMDTFVLGSIASGYPYTYPPNELQQKPVMSHLEVNVSAAAIEHAVNLSERVLKLLKQYPLRYAGTDGNGGQHGRVQILIKEKWYSVRGLSSKNFKIP